MWSPLASKIIIWKPIGDFPNDFNERDKIACTAYYEYAVRAKKMNNLKAQDFAIKQTYKAKFHGIKY
jgi:hypothetical protein